MTRSKDFPIEKDVSDEELEQKMKPVIEELSRAVKSKVEVKQIQTLPLSEDHGSYLFT